VVRHADDKNIIELSVELRQLSEKARSRKITIEEMQGGCFSISNLGGIGGSYFTPIINAPEVAILGIARATTQPVWKPIEREPSPASGEFIPRLMLPLSLSYDHRVIDGADGIHFLRWVADALEQPFLLALEG
jgi:pyruvate dehydrogenase E2 component (dihydrolipoamide acetyltransferase)